MQNKLRTSLTGFAVAWGVFMLIALLGAGNGLMNATSNNSRDFQTNTIAIFSGSTSKAYNGMNKDTWMRMKDEDFDRTVGDRYDDVIDEASPAYSYSGVFSRGKEYITTAQIVGVAPIYVNSEGIKMVAGRFINKFDVEQNRKTIVLDTKSASILMPESKDSTAIIGHYIKVDSLAFKVVGLYHSDDVSDFSEFYSAYTTIKTIYNNAYIPRIVFSFHGLETEQENTDFENRYRTDFNKAHYAAPDDTETLYFWNRLTQNMSMVKSQKIIRTILWLIGLFTLLSGVVGVSNIMLITVKERIHEFGIRKALGATPGSIVRLVVVESIVITAFFGFVGMLCGLIACQVMDATLGNNPIDMGPVQMYMFKNPTVGIDVAVKATLTLIIAGTLAGFFPARKAAKVKPIEALNNAK